KNQGTFGAPGPFRTGFWKTRAAPPGPGDTPDTLLTSGTLAPGATWTFHVSRTSSAVATWTAYAYVDWPNWVPEGTADTNNVKGSAPIIWRLPSIDVSGRFAFVDSFTQVPRYPRCARVRIVEDNGTVQSDSTLDTTYCDAQGRFGPINIPN